MGSSLTSHLSSNPRPLKFHSSTRHLRSPVTMQLTNLIVLLAAVPALGQNLGSGAASGASSVLSSAISGAGSATSTDSAVSSSVRVQLHRLDHLRSFQLRRCRVCLSPVRSRICCKQLQFRRVRLLSQPFQSQLRCCEQRHWCCILPRFLDLGCRPTN